MAENNSVLKGSVLRIKRKRTEDPYEVLLIHNSNCKKSKDDTGTNIDAKGLFQFACSVNASDDISAPDVDSIIQKHSKTRQPTHSALKPSRISEIRKAIRLERREMQSSERFKAVLDQRNPNVESNCCSVESGYKVYDVIRDGNNMTPPCPSSSSNTPSIDATIRKMEECLDLDDESRNEYIHDYYISNDPCHTIAETSFDVEPIAEDYWLDILHYQKHNNENHLHDDDDDSNDENNWRNDYPDEGDAFHNKDTDTDDSSSSDDDGDIYRSHGSRQTRSGQFDYDKYNYEDFDDQDNNGNHFADDFYGN